ncbi:MAG TPA: hypothetical protein DEA63_01025 [Firmicutes bacterium]|nr:hypothetical protein [Bacillota bacterium]
MRYRDDAPLRRGIRHFNEGRAICLRFGYPAPKNDVRRNARRSSVFDIPNTPLELSKNHFLIVG